MPIPAPGTPAPEFRINYKIQRCLPGEEGIAAMYLAMPKYTAVGFSAIRGLPGGRMRQYSQVEFTNGWPGADRYHRMFAGTGSIVASSTDPSYAVLDVLDVDGEVSTYPAGGEQVIGRYRSRRVAEWITGRLPERTGTRLEVRPAEQATSDTAKKPHDDERGDTRAYL